MEVRARNMGEEQGPLQVWPFPASPVSPQCPWTMRCFCHPHFSGSPGGGSCRNSWEDLGTVAAPGNCHEEKAPEGGKPLSNVLLPHCVRTFPSPRIFPRMAGLCLNPRSPTALHRRAETHCAWSHRGTADIRGMWMMRWSLVTL